MEKDVTPKQRGLPHTPEREDADEKYPRPWSVVECENKVFLILDNNDSVVADCRAVDVAATIVATINNT